MSAERNAVNVWAKAVWGAGPRALAIGAAIATAVSCGDLQRDGTGSSFLIVSSLEAAPGAQPDEFGGTLLSDVVTTKDDQTGAFNDLGKVRFTLGLKDPGSATNPNRPTQANAITIDRYHVRFIRADGRNVQGVDVPYAFDGAFSVTVFEQAEGGFTIVRHNSKLEAPLLALRTNGMIISTIAEVPFSGHDQTGRAVEAVGRIGIDFGNFADPQ